jgi:hypothetical protein
VKKLVYYLPEDEIPDHAEFKATVNLGARISCLYEVPISEPAQSQDARIKLLEQLVRRAASFALICRADSWRPGSAPPQLTAEQWLKDLTGCLGLSLLYALVAVLRRLLFLS